MKKLAVAMVILTLLCGNAYAVNFFKKCSDADGGANMNGKNCTEWSVISTKNMDKCVVSYKLKMVNKKNGKVVSKLFPEGNPSGISNETINCCNARKNPDQECGMDLSSLICSSVCGIRE